MLLKAGRSIKQTIFYNVLVTVTPAGIFLYMALVPELTSGHAH